MSVFRILAGWIMRLATLRPPPARAEWATAMEREYETLEHGALGWALGCLTTRIGWTLRAQWLYILLLLLPPIMVNYADELLFDLAWYRIIPREAFTSLMRDYGALYALLTPLPLAILLGYYRPARIGMTMVVGCLLAQHAGGTAYASYSLDEPFFSWWTGGSTLYMAPPLIGLCASLWVWYMGASLGARLARKRISRTASLPDPRW